MASGSIQEVTLKGRRFAVAADADAARKLGGFENEVQANGDGSARLVKTRVQASISGLTIVIDDRRGDQEFLQEVADSNDFVDGTMTLVSGATWEGDLQIVGELAFSTMNGTAEIGLEGPGTLTMQ